MGKSIKHGELGAAIERELTIYGQEIQDGIVIATIEAMEILVVKTKATAPKGERGSFRKKITADYQGLNRRGDKSKGQFRGRTFRATWYVKAPDYRLTHLIVHGHATKDGNRTKPNTFLQDALDEVLPAYEEAIKEAIKK